jgi:methyl-accepting chemotaxis protein
MPTIERVFRVFVASPSDLIPERDALEGAIAELNQTVGRTQNIRLELLRWETGTHPAFGADPQSLVNQQIREDYDIFVGLFWYRFGTATPRSGSGTQEEFERAYERFLRSPQSIEIMFYFKDAPVSPSRIDAAQLDKVLRFREQVAERGLLGTFSSTEEFQALARMHLTRVISTWEQRAALGPAPEDLSIDEPATTEADLPEEPGFLDLVEASSENFALANAVVNRIATYISDFSEAMRELTVRMDEIDAATPAGTAEAKRAVNSFAQRMHHFASQLSSDIPLLREPFGTAIGATQGAAQLLADFPGDPRPQLEGNLAGLRNLERTIPETIGVIASMRQNLERLPRVTTQFNRSRRTAREALEQLEIELAAENRLVTEAARLQVDLLQNFEKIVNTSPQLDG